MLNVSGVCSVLLLLVAFNANQHALATPFPVSNSVSSIETELDGLFTQDSVKTVKSQFLQSQPLQPQLLPPAPFQFPLHQAKYLLLGQSELPNPSVITPQLKLGPNPSPNPGPAAITEPDPTQPLPQDYRSVDPASPSIFPESVSLDFRSSAGSDDKFKRILEPTAQFYLPNGDEIRLTTGWNFLDQKGLDSVSNYPVRLGWKGKSGETTFAATAGIDFFDDLPAVPNLNARIDLPFGTTFDRQGRLSQMLIVSTAVDYGAYKFSAKSLRSRVTATQIKPSIYWQISPSTNFYGHYQVGIYNDGNYEQQVFSRLQQKLGSEFFVAANLFSWRFSKDEERSNGYFSPPDFLTYTGELGWEGNVIKNRLKCRLSVAFGRQRNQGDYAGASVYNAHCDARLSPDFSLELGYALSNIRDRSSPNDFQTQEFSGQLKYRFD